MPAPTRCVECPSTDFELVGGEVIYPHRPDLASKKFWRCSCGAYCGCHPTTEDPLGFPAGPQTRSARSHVHAKLDPLWQDAPSLYKPGGKLSPNQIRSMARTRVYKYLADRMGITKKECHTGMFTIEQCRQAYRILMHLSYRDVRNWIHEQRSAA
jgi:hypothetical protein